MTKSAVVHRCIWYIHFTSSYCLINTKISGTKYRWLYHCIPSCCLINIKILDTKYRCLYSCIPSCFLINTKILDTKYQCLYRCISVTKSAVVHRCILYIHFTPSYCLINTKILDTKCHYMYRCISVTKSAVVYNGTFGAGVSPATKEMPVSQYSRACSLFCVKIKTRMHSKGLACLLPPKRSLALVLFPAQKKNLACTLRGWRITCH